MQDYVEDLLDDELYDEDDEMMIDGDEM